MYLLVFNTYVFTGFSKIEDWISHNDGLYLVLHKYDSSKCPWASVLLWIVQLGLLVLSTKLQPYWCSPRSFIFTCVLCYFVSTYCDGFFLPFRFVLTFLAKISLEVKCPWSVVEGISSVWYACHYFSVKSL